MLTLVHVRSPRTSVADSTPLAADYVAFDRRRTARRQYVKAFGGMALVVFLGALLGRVPANEAWIVIGLLLTPPLTLVAVEVVQWHRLVRRLDRVRAEAHESKKVVKKS